MELHADPPVAGLGREELVAGLGVVGDLHDGDVESAAGLHALERQRVADLGDLGRGAALLGGGLLLGAALGRGGGPMRVWWTMFSPGFGGTHVKDRKEPAWLYGSPKISGGKGQPGSPM
ncbi:hypothetical protein ACFZBP_01925 [Streptomyces sp. NPDC008086]|uniref:hypothetical protein n=1 Tax=Streptomyces sp. NPDC008086 TaxID=3364807 RepID=UPI0036E7EE4D